MCLHMSFLVEHDQNFEQLLFDAGWWQYSISGPLMYMMHSWLLAAHSLGTITSCLLILL